MNADELRRLSDDDLVRKREWLLANVPETTHSELLTYEQAAKALGVKYERVAVVVSQGVLIAEKLPHDAKKYLGLDQIGWYRLKQQGKDEGYPNPKLVRDEVERRATLARQAQLYDTLTDVRTYVAENMEGTDTAAQLNTLLAAIASDIVGTLIMESLPDEKRERLTALLSTLTQKGQTRTT
jgi:hypothetical protein